MGNMKNMAMFSGSPTEMFSGSQQAGIFSGSPTLFNLFIHSIYGFGEHDPGSAQNWRTSNDNII